MKKIILPLFLILTACAQQNLIPQTMASNALPVQVGSCPGGYVNEPCTSVTICSPGTNNCQTVNNILVDTGSSGLRIFKNVSATAPLITIPLQNETDSSGNIITQCYDFGTGANWGPVAKADIILGGEPPVTVPIQVIDSTFAKVPGTCISPDTFPSAAGFNGILGIGLFKQDCGAGCDTNGTQTNTYFFCNGTTCNSTTATNGVTLANQVSNPVFYLPLDNNGVIIQLPSVPATGATSINGSLILGIGTRANNMPSGQLSYAADPAVGNFQTVFNGTNYTDSFIDSGSNGIFFPKPASMPVLVKCTGSNFYCPASTLSFTGTPYAYSANASGGTAISFQIANAQTLFATSNNVFSNLGGNLTLDPKAFDWGIPFFYGRTVFIGFENTQTSFGSGPYWAF